MRPSRAETEHIISSCDAIHERAGVVNSRLRRDGVAGYRCQCRVHAYVRACVRAYVSSAPGALTYSLALVLKL